MVKDLDSMITAVSHDQLILFVDSNEMGILELAFSVSQHPKFADEAPSRLQIPTMPTVATLCYQKFDSCASLDTERWREFIPKTK